MTGADETPTAELLRPALREVFLSYARADLALAERVADALEAAGRSTWIDRRGIEPTEEWLAAIYAGIDRSDNFTLLVTPRSVASPWCAKEVDAAAAHNKRLIPVLLEPTDPVALPPLMAARQWIDCVSDFDAGVAQLLEALDRDLAYVHEHTRLLGRAIDWKNNRGGLLARSELESAERWLASARKEPAPSAQHTELIVASRRAATRTQWRILIAAAVAVIVAVSLAIAAFLQRNDARRQRAEAERQQSEAERQRNVARRQTIAATRNLADTRAAHALASVKPREALRAAVAAIDTAITPASRDALLRVLQRTDKLHVILDPDTGGVHLQRLTFDAAGTQLAAAPYQGAIEIWDLRTRKSRLSGRTGVQAESMAVHGDMVASGTDVWRGSEEEPFFTLPEGDEPRALAMTSGRIAAARGDFIEICPLDDEACATAEAPGVELLAFTGPNARWLVTASQNAIGIRDGRTLRLARTVTLPARVVALGGSAVAPSTTVVLADTTVCTLNLASNSRDCSEENDYADPTVAHVYGPSTIADSQLAVAVDKKLFAITDHSGGVGFINVDSSISVWDASRTRGELVPLRRLVAGDIAAASPDGSRILVRDARARVKLMNAVTGAVVGPPFTPAGKAVACSTDLVASVGREVTLHDARTGAVKARVPLPKDGAVMFSPDGALLAVSNAIGVRFYAMPSGAQVGKVLAIGGRTFAFVPGRRAILAFDGTSVAQWDIETAARSSPRMLDAGQHDDWDSDDAEIQILAFSPDGKKLATNGGGYGEGMTPRLLLWDLERGKVVADRAFTDYSTSITSIAFGRDVIVTADRSRIRLFDAASLTPLGEPIEVDSIDPFIGCTARVFADGSHAGAVCDRSTFLFSMDVRAWRNLALQRAGK